MHPASLEYIFPPVGNSKAERLELTDIAPREAMPKPWDRSPEWLLDQPAIMNAAEIVFFLDHFKKKPKSLEALRNLLIEAKNEPYTASRQLRNVEGAMVQDPVWMAHHDITKRLSKLVFNGRKFRLVTKMVGKGTTSQLQVQLWQLKKVPEPKPPADGNVDVDPAEDDEAAIIECSKCFKKKAADEIEKNIGICDDCLLMPDDGGNDGD